ncbi:MAG TPA: DUF1850 domain-containing protein [Rubrivivax sp.]|nr:DUF1850 domain-containing protein [Rubrivivax sp.]
MNGTTLGICLALAGGAQGTADPPVFVAAPRFTLAWTHSIERVRWEEDYEVHAATATSEPVLRAVMSRVRGSAAGMEPGPDAVLRDGWYHYRPAQLEHAALWLTRSAYTADYELCLEGAACRPLAAWLPSDGWRTRLKACRGGR